MIVGKLKPHDHTMPALKKIFASDRIEFPHPREAFVIERGDLFPVP